MTDMHPYEALKIALQEARDERDDWRESATRAAGESCGDERHCTCVGPLRKELRDAKAKLAALVKASQPFANDQGCDAVHHGLADRHDQRDTCPVVARLREALAAAKVQP